MTFHSQGRRRTRCHTLVYKTFDHRPHSRVCAARWRRSPLET